jgi:hypothetical protein
MLCRLNLYKRQHRAGRALVDAHGRICHVQVDRASGSSKVVGKGKYPSKREYERAGGALKARRRTNLNRWQHDVPLLVDSHVSRSPRAVYPQQQAVSGIREIVPDDMARAAAACVEWREGGGSERAGTRRPCEARAADASGAGSAPGGRRTRQDAGFGRDGEARAHASRSA